VTGSFKSYKDLGSAVIAWSFLLLLLEENPGNKNI
jgi:hypothetical protein